MRLRLHGMRLELVGIVVFYSLLWRDLRLQEY